jgi:hypothetical protein
MMYKIYLNGGYIATGEYKNPSQARRAFAKLFKINMAHFTAEEVTGIHCQRCIIKENCYDVQGI